MFERAKAKLLIESGDRFTDGLKQMATELEYLQIAARDRNIEETKKWIKRIEDTANEVAAAGRLYRWML